MCCGALDEIANKIKEPNAADIPNSSSYFNMKGFFAHNTQAMCDPQYRCTFVSCLAAGSTQDSTAYSINRLARLLSKSDERLLDGLSIAADDAYTCVNRLLTPWPGRKLSRSKDCLKYWQLSARIFIEQAFGILVARWGVLWRPPCCSIEKNAEVVIVCCKLHNFIIERRGGIEVLLYSNMDDGSYKYDADREIH